MSQGTPSSEGLVEFCQNERQSGLTLVLYQGTGFGNLIYHGFPLAGGKTWTMAMQSGAKGQQVWERRRSGKGKYAWQGRGWIGTVAEDKSLKGKNSRRMHRSSGLVRGSFCIRIWRSETLSTGWAELDNLGQTGSSILQVWSCEGDGEAWGEPICKTTWL